MSFDAQGNLLVGNYTTGVLYKFPPQGGAADPGHQVGTAPVFGGGGLGALAFTQDGSLYATGKAGPFCADLSTIAQIDPTNATVLRSLSSPSCPTSLAVDPLSGDLFDANGSALFRLSNFASGSGTLSTYVSNIDGDGLAFASDGTLYAAVNGEVDSITGTNSQNPGTVTQLVAVPTADGIALAPNPGDPTHPTLYVNANNGSITKIDTSSMATTQIYSGGSRGDFVTVGPDGCLYATQTDRVIRVSKSDGSCLALATPNTAPALGITPTSVAPSPAQGSSLTFTATLNNVASPAMVRSRLRQLRPGSMWSRPDLRRRPRCSPR